MNDFVTLTHYGHRINQQHGNSSCVLVLYWFTIFECKATGSFSHTMWLLMSTHDFNSSKC